MSITAKIEAAVNSAILDANKFKEATFAIEFKKANAMYDVISGAVGVESAVVNSTIILPEAALAEIDGEASKVTSLQGIILRSWLPESPEIDDAIKVMAGVYEGDYIITTAPQTTIAHYELSLTKVVAGQ